MLFFNKGSGHGTKVKSQPPQVPGCPHACSPWDGVESQPRPRCLAVAPAQVPWSLWSQVWQRVVTQGPLATQKVSQSFETLALRCLGYFLESSVLWGGEAVKDGVISTTFFSF